MVFQEAVVWLSLKVPLHWRLESCRPAGAVFEVFPAMASRFHRYALSQSHSVLCLLFSFFPLTNINMGKLVKGKSWIVRLLTDTLSCSHPFHLYSGLWLFPSCSGSGVTGTALHREFTLLAQADGKCMNWKHDCLEGFYYRSEGENLQRRREASKAERERLAVST